MGRVPLCSPCGGAGARSRLVRSWRTRRDRSRCRLPRRLHHPARGGARAGVERILCSDLAGRHARFRVGHLHRPIRWWPVTVLAASVAAQSHELCAVVAVVVCLVSAAVGVNARARFGEAARFGWLFAGVSVALAAWCAPIVQQFTGRPGNLTLWWRAQHMHLASFGISKALGAISSMTRPYPQWMHAVPRGGTLQSAVYNVAIFAGSRWWGITAFVLVAVIGVAGVADAPARACRARRDPCSPATSRCFGSLACSPRKSGSDVHLSGGVCRRHRCYRLARDARGRGRAGASISTAARRLRGPVEALRPAVLAGGVGLAIALGAMKPRERGLARTRGVARSYRSEGRTGYAGRGRSGRPPGASLSVRALRVRAGRAAPTASASPSGSATS